MKQLMSLAIVLAAIGSPLAAQDEVPEGASVTLGEVRVSPQNPGVETLCRLRVEIENRSPRPVSELAFAVTLNGRPLDVYEAQLFYQEVPAAETAEVRLFNFWTTETGREIPPGGELVVEVTLEGARYFEIETAREDGEEVEVWTPLEPVSGLPTSRSLRLKLSTEPSKE